VVGARPVAQRSAARLGLWTRLRLACRAPIVRILSLMFLVGQACDVLTTHVALASGRFDEANPLFAPALASNEALALLVKLAIAGLVLLAALTKLTGTRRVVVLGVLAFIALEAPATNALRILGLM
jgi:Domain of unknown function (DUF5658)